MIVDFNHHKYDLSGSADTTACYAGFAFHFRRQKEMGSAISWLDRKNLLTERFRKLAIVSSVRILPTECVDSLPSVQVSSTMYVDDGAEIFRNLTPSAIEYFESRKVTPDDLEAARAQSYLTQCARSLIEIYGDLMVERVLQKPSQQNS